MDTLIPFIILGQVNTFLSKSKSKFSLKNTVITR